MNTLKYYALSALGVLLLGCAKSPSTSPRFVSVEESTSLKFPPELVQFTPYEGNPVFAGTGTDTWDQRIRERGFILKEEDGYHLWYTGYTKTGTDQTKYLGYATSADGLAWTRHPANPIHTGQWVEDVFVLKEQGTYYMFAESQDDIAHLFTSTDRLHWTDRGALDIRLKNGKPLEAGPYGTPTVWKQGKTWYLYYERNDAAIWLATSKDLKVWTNVQDEPVLAAGPEAVDKHGVAMNQIVQYQGLYYAYYHATAYADWREWSTNVAVSKDLIHWEKYPRNPIMGNNTSSGILVPDGTRYRLYTMHPEVNVYWPAGKTN
ncbi:hypothetical protein GCM10027275_14980 [Rhabdobacter roseus]|uniref:Putative GH43/DUF377 family glycosyl hydrolase n=1 Tax=Rhabdobacter roseus TaxID=1655419 RepID=A0A840TTQ2_9BACT|nr:glycosylase [Rhabdobacter roseus]MBB5283418.1 putative GH43/DUF377 family glycosyl hydrolase [Rhabdobacter roseus]